MEQKLAEYRKNKEIQKKKDAQKKAVKDFLGGIWGNRQPEEKTPENEQSSKIEDQEELVPPPEPWTKIDFLILAVGILLWAAVWLLTVHYEVRGH